MNQSNKALRDGAKEIIVEITTDHDCNLLSDKIMDIYVDRLFALVTNHIKGALPEKFPEVGVTQNQIDFARGYNQALDEVHQLLKDMGVE